MRLSEAFAYAEKHKERLRNNKLALIGAIHDSDSDHAPFKFFKVEFDPADELESFGPWYYLEYYGGNLFESEGGFTEEGDGNSGVTIEEAFENAIQEFPILENTAFIETIDVDIDSIAEYLLPILINDLPESNEYWPSKMDQFKKLCLDALSVRNRMDSVNH